jgi:D-alanyl-D-alanine carboxypeptidase
MQVPLSGHGGPEWAMRVAILALFMASPVVAEMPTLPAADVAAINAAIVGEMTEKNLPSVTVGVWIPGRGAYVVARGVADLGTGAARRVEDPFRIGSVTKTMIGTVALQLAEEGALSLDDPIGRWFPDFPNAGAITVDDLLRMRSGIWDSWTDEALAAYYADPLHPPSMDEMIARSAAEGARFAPPDRETVYVNMNFILLDRIIATVANMPTSQVLQARLFEPLGLMQTALPDASVLPGQLRGYGWNAETQVYEDRTELDPGPVGGAGAAISSLADLEVFVRALCAGTLLPPAVQEARMATEPFAGRNGVARYGQAVARLGPFCGHNGTIMGFSTEAWYLPSEEAVIVVSVSRLDADDRSMSGDLFGKLARALFPDAL